MSGDLTVGRVVFGDSKPEYKTINVPAHTLRVRVARPRLEAGVACECTVASHCEKFGGCLAETDAADVTITRIGSGNQAADAKRADATNRSAAPK